MKSIKVFIAEDHEIMRIGIRDLLLTVPDFEVIGGGVNGENAIEMAVKLRPDVITMDIMMPGLNGIEATRKIHQLSPGIKIIALSVYSDREFVIDMFKAGASGYIIKEEACHELTEAIRSVLNNTLFLGKTLARTVGKDMLGWMRDNGDGLTINPVERAVLEYMIEGIQPDKIASLLSASLESVEKMQHSLLNQWLTLFQ